MSVGKHSTGELHAENKLTKKYLRQYFDADLLISEADVGTAIDKLNNGKSVDEYGLSSEHFKAFGSESPCRAELSTRRPAESKVYFFKSIFRGDTS